MTTDIDLRLERLIALWIAGDRVSLAAIPPLCDEITALADHTPDHDPSLLRRAARLASAADERLAICLRIQSRTGAYSGSGGLEVVPHLATNGWRG